VFIWFLGPIAYRITHREPDLTVKVLVYRYEVDDKAFSEPPLDKNGEIVRARLLNQIAGYKPRTEYLSSRIADFAKEGRKILILSDRRSHLKDFESCLKKLECTDIGYYVGSMKQEALEISEKNQIILGTFAMASEAMNIPALNTILLATPKSNIEQSVGRILREKKEVRKFNPLILEVLDYQHVGCIGQYRKRRDYYKACGYTICVIGKDEVTNLIDSPSPTVDIVEEPVLADCAIVD
jgi:superfamily II DNA or RNA helicase